MTQNNYPPEYDYENDMELPSDDENDAWYERPDYVVDDNDPEVTIADMTEEERRYKEEDDERDENWNQNLEANQGYRDLMAEISPKLSKPPSLKPLTEPLSLRPLSSWAKPAKVPEVMEVDVNHPPPPPNVSVNLAKASEVMEVDVKPAETPKVMEVDPPAPSEEEVNGNHPPPPPKLSVKLAKASEVIEVDVKPAETPKVIEVDSEHPPAPLEMTFQSTDVRDRKPVYKVPSARKQGYAKGKEAKKQSQLATKAPILTETLRDKVANKPSKVENQKISTKNEKQIPKPKEVKVTKATANSKVPSPVNTKTTLPDKYYKHTGTSSRKLHPATKSSIPSNKTAKTIPSLMSIKIPPAKLPHSMDYYRVTPPPSLLTSRPPANNNQRDLTAQWLKLVSIWTNTMNKQYRW